MLDRKNSKLSFNQTVVSQTGEMSPLSTRKKSFRRSESDKEEGRIIDVTEVLKKKKKPEDVSNTDGKEEARIVGLSLV